MKNSITLIAMLVILFIIINYGYNKVTTLEQNYKQSLSIIEGKDKSLQVNESLFKDLTKRNEELKKQIKDFKTVESVTKTITKFIVDTVYIRADSTSIDTASGQFFSSFNSINPFYTISGNCSNSGFQINTIQIPNKQTIIVGDKKIKGFLGVRIGTEFSVDVKNSNPYIQTIDVKNYTIKKEKKWYQRPGFLIGTGVIGGFLLAK